MLAGIPAAIGISDILEIDGEPHFRLWMIPDDPGRPAQVFIVPVSSARFAAALIVRTEEHTGRSAKHGN